MRMVLRVIAKKGGPGSGHFEHSGRPGKVGGSLPEKAGSESPKASSKKINVTKNQYGYYTNGVWEGTIILASRVSEEEAIKNSTTIVSTFEKLPTDDAKITKVLANNGDMWLGSASYIESQDELWLFNKWNSKNEGDKQRAIAHEIGHRVQSKQPSLFSTFKKSKLDRHFSTIIPKEFHKGYTEPIQRTAEVFAESYALYYLQPSTLKSKYPDLYDFWDDRK